MQGIDAGGRDKMQPAALIDAIILAGFFVEGDRKAYRVFARVWHGSPFQVFEDERTHFFVQDGFLPEMDEDGFRKFKRQQDNTLCR